MEGLGPSPLYNIVPRHIVPGSSDSACLFYRVAKPLLTVSYNVRMTTIVLSLRKEARDALPGA
jgi:hypothetical protein